MQRLFPPPPIAAPVHRPIGPPVTLMRMSALSPTLQAVRTAVEARLAWTLIVPDAPARRPPPMSCSTRPRT